MFSDYYHGITDVMNTSSVGWRILPVEKALGDDFSNRILYQWTRPWAMTSLIDYTTSTEGLGR